MLNLSRREALPNIEDVVPYFQPILSLQTQKMAGYEVLGRVSKNRGIESLGPYFFDPRVKIEEKMKVDQRIWEMALQKFQTAPAGSSLYFNVKPSWLLDKQSLRSISNRLELMKKYNVIPHRMVVEITEDQFSGEEGELLEAIHAYRQAGCQIAIDDMGSGYSNFDRMALIRPDMIKIDLNLMKKSFEHQGYHDLLRSFSILAEQMGAHLVMEGIETTQDLQHALDTGANLVQGYLFSPAKPGFNQANDYEDLLLRELDIFQRRTMKKHKKLIFIENDLHHLFANLKLHATKEPDEMIEKIIPFLNRMGIRLYICGENGVQISSNYLREADGNWSKDIHIKGMNWISRPYFIPNILKMKQFGKGILSQGYRDLSYSKEVYTFSYPILENDYLFLDLFIS